MTFKDYIYSAAMVKITEEKALHYIRELTLPDLELDQNGIQKVFWTWFFEITRDGAASWNSFVQENDRDTMEAMVMDCKTAICNSLKGALGEMEMYVEETPEWSIRAFEIYTTVFSDYIQAVVPGFIQVSKGVLHPEQNDEGIDEE